LTILYFYYLPQKQKYNKGIILEWIDKVTNIDLRLEIKNNYVLMKRITMLISMSATEIKKNNSNILKGISIRISEILFESGIITESQHKRISSIKKNNKKGFKKKL
jgi:hypothetical protein